VYTEDIYKSPGSIAKMHVSIQPEDGEERKEHDAVIEVEQSHRNGRDERVNQHVRRVDAMCVPVDWVNVRAV